MIMNNEMPDRWYSTKEICAYLGISRDTMLVWIATKNMPAHKVGRNWKFKVSEVDRKLWMELILLVAGAMYFGILSLENFSRGAALLLILTVAVFWLQGVIWGAVAKLFRKEK